MLLVYKCCEKLCSHFLVVLEYLLCLNPESTKLSSSALRLRCILLLPDGHQIIIGGRVVFNLEFIPPSINGALYIAFLNAMNDAENDNLYPFVHLLPDGNLYVFANQDSIVYNYMTNTMVKTFPTIPGNPRNYPSAGSSVMLPLLAANQYSIVEVLVCGGAQNGAFLAPWLNKPCSITCKRIIVTDPNPVWAEEDMPLAKRILSEALTLVVLQHDVRSHFLSRRRLCNRQVPCS